MTIYQAIGMMRTVRPDLVALGARIMGTWEAANEPMARLDCGGSVGLRSGVYILPDQDPAERFGFGDRG